MVKAYLRYEGDACIGVITARECNVAAERTGKFVLTGCLDCVGVWSLRQGALVRSLRTPKSAERVTWICLKGGVKPILAAGYSDGTVRVWNYEDGSVLQTLQGHRSSVSCISFSQDGHLLASGSSDTDIVIWDTVSEAGVARLRGHIDQVTAVLFWEGAPIVADSSSAPGPKSRLISSSKDRFVRIWSIDLQLCLQTITEHKAEVWCLALNASQTRLAAGSADKFLRLWSLSPEASGSEDEPLASFLGAVPRPQGQGNAICLQYVRPAGIEFDVLLCQGAGRVLEAFRCYAEGDVKRRGKRRKKRALIKKQKQAAKAPMKGEEEEDDAAEGEDDGAHAADELMALTSYRCAAKAQSFAWCSSTNTAVMGLTNNALETLQLSPEAEEAENSAGLQMVAGTGIDMPGHRTAVRALAVSHDDSLVLSASAEAVKIWSTSTGRCVRTMPSGYGLCGFFVIGNEHVVLGTKEGKIEMYDLRVAELAQQREEHEGAIYGLAENPDCQGFVSCSADKHLRFYAFTFTEGSASESVVVNELPDKAIELPDEGLAVAYSPNGKWVAAALLNHTVVLYFADTMKFYLSLYGHRLPVMAIDISSDSQMAASGSADKNIKLWSTQFGNCHRSLRAHEESVMQVRFLPGTHYLASAGRDRELKLWDCDTYELITSLRGHGSEILALALSKDAAFIATAGGDRQIRFWKRTSEQLFLSEERAQELEESFEKEVEREDVQTPGAGGQSTALRPSRRTVESVRTTERLMEILDEAVKEEAGEDTVSLSGMHPCIRVVRYLNTLTASNIYEVLLCLPFSHAMHLLGFLHRFFEAVCALPAGDGDNSERAKSLSSAVALETPLQAALIIAYVHHSELAMTTRARTLLLKLRQQMRTLLQAEKDRIGLNIAGFAHMQRVLKRSGRMPIAPSTASGAGQPAGSTSAKKRKR